MGLFDSILNLAEDIITLPVAVIKDVIHPGKALDGDSETVKKLGDIGKDLTGE